MWENPKNIPIGTKVKIRQDKRLLEENGLEVLLELPDIFEENFKVVNSHALGYELEGKNLDDLVFPESLLIKP